MMYKFILVIKNLSLVLKLFLVVNFCSNRLTGKVSVGDKVLKNNLIIVVKSQIKLILFGKNSLRL